MPDIVLAALNAKFIHASFGLRYLLANMGPLAPETKILEFDINRPIPESCETVLRQNPKILGLGVYIWNARQSLELVQLLKSVRPELTIVLGGPEVSFETEGQPITALADYTVCGEGDLAFPSLCRNLLEGRRPDKRIVRAEPPALEALSLPYALYTETDLANRIVYVESSRGCAFGCEFCLSSLSDEVRRFPVEKLLAEFEKLLSRNLLHFKFVDRTFNLSIPLSRQILEFFLDRSRPGLFLHFEMVPDRFPSELRTLIKSFPPGTLQFEVGIQSLNPAVQEAIGRKQDLRKSLENLRFLREETAVHVHADLIAGLPGENLESFGEGFDKLLSLRPHEIQIEILKRLRGTPITRSEGKFQMRFQPFAPYELISNDSLRFEDVQRLKRFSRYFDLVVNSGHFPKTPGILWQEGKSPFLEFLGFSDWLYEQVQGTAGISLKSLACYLHRFLVQVRGFGESEIAELIAADLEQAGRIDAADAFVSTLRTKSSRADGRPRKAPPRQSRHRQGASGRE